MVADAGRVTAGLALEALRALVPAEVALHAAAYDEHDPRAGEGVALPPELARAVPKRRAEFLAGRACARAALAAAGHAEAAALAIGPRRAPVWPRGFVGSITHAGGIAAAAAARAAHVRALGIDLEHVLAAADVADLAPTIATPAELAAAARAGFDDAAALTAVFAAKEALFKALAPHVGRYFDFLDAAVVHATPTHLTIALTAPLTAALPAGARFTAGVARAGAAVVAAIHVPETATPEH